MYRKGLFDGVPTVFIAESLARALVRTQTVVEATWAAAKKQLRDDYQYEQFSHVFKLKAGPLTRDLVVSARSNLLLIGFTGVIGQQ